MEMRYGWVRAHAPFRHSRTTISEATCSPQSSDVGEGIPSHYGWLGSLLSVALREAWIEIRHMNNQSQHSF